MRNNQYAQELSDEDLELVVGGTQHHHHTAPCSGSKAKGAHIEETVAVSESFTVDTGKGKSVSFAFAFAFAVEV